MKSENKYKYSDVSFIIIKERLPGGKEMTKEQKNESYLTAGIVGLSNLVPLTEASIIDLKSIAKPVELKKGDIVVKNGEIVTGIHFMIKGLGRSFTYKGKAEITSWIIQEGEPFTNYKSYCTQVPSRESTEIIEGGFAFFLPRKGLVELCVKHNCISNMIVVLNERNFIKMDDHFYEILYKTAEERYNSFISEYPTMFSRMKLKDIASYLNMAPETLSRIRNKELLGN